MRIDSHQHFWRFDPVRDRWITAEMDMIRQDFMPADLKPILQRNGFEACIAVQADQSHLETDFLVALAIQNSFIKGVIGWVDFRSPQIGEYLKKYKKQPLIKGFRHVVEAEADPDFLIRDSFQNGLAQLVQYGFTYDLLVSPKHYASVLTCVSNNPEQQFILDHIAKPPIKIQEFDDWAHFIEQLSSFPNVSCKVSGLATEADWNSWKLENFARYLEHVFACFGHHRIMFGSDWPVCLLAASYEEGIAIVESKLDTFDTNQRDAFWALNAVKIYNL